MSHNASSKGLPPYRSVNFRTLSMKAPIAFTDVSVRGFVLRASMDKLQQICNGSLNTVPPEVGYYRAMLPYVFLVLLDYGRISLGVNQGWFSQFEVYLSTFAEWYRVVNGKWVFHDYALITPYIFVDDDFSPPLGREIYGWPKTLARVTPTQNPWLLDSNASATLATVETEVFPKTYQGRRPESRVLLEVLRDPPVANLQWPAGQQNPLAPWVMASNMAQAMARLSQDAAKLFQGMWLSAPNAGTNPAFVPEMLAQIARMLAPGGRDLGLNTINLKQFRQSEDPSRFCYQGLTNGRMSVTGINAVGLLGEERLLSGDLSGGYTIRLHQYPSYPIAETLGLEVDQRWRGEGGDVLSIKPLMPFLVNANVVYQQGSNLAWRTRDGIWRKEDGDAFDRSQKAEPGSSSTLFNSTLGSAVDAIAGPFRFHDTTIRVLPLLADRTTLSEYLDTYFNKPLEGNDVRLSLWAHPIVRSGDRAYVYMSVSSFGAVTSPANNIGDWAKYELSFLVPVKWERKSKDGWQVQGVGLVPAHTFVDQITAAQARTEVLGIPTVRANFVRPESEWLQGGEPNLDGKQLLLCLEAEVLPAMGEGQGTAMHRVVEIAARNEDPRFAGLTSRANAWEWAETLRGELGSKKIIKARHPRVLKAARALALELLGNHVPVVLYTLKQFRDVVDPGKACYQSLVRVSRVLAEVFDVREIEETLHVRILDYPTLDIVKSLGIYGKAIESDGAGVVFSTQAIRPFYIRATIDERCGERLLSRAGPLGWERGDHPFRSILSDEEGGPPITADRPAEALQDKGDPCRMGNVMYQAHYRWETNPYTKKEARRAVALVDPQMVIESLLSREWGNCDENTRWRRGRRELMMLPDLLAGGTTPELEDVEATLYEGIYTLRRSRPGSIHITSHKKTIEGMRIFTQERLRMEQFFGVLAGWEISRRYGPLSSQPAEGTRGDPTAADPATPADVCDKVLGLLKSLSALATMTIEGEPNANNNMSTQVGGYAGRLHDLLNGPLGAVLTQAALRNRQGMEFVWSYGDQIFEAVALARKYCGAQQEALLNSLSRIYQKPDFCVRRDSVGPERDQLLPITGAWDEDWYFGNIITASDGGNFDFEVDGLVETSQEGIPEEGDPGDPETGVV